jgi:hypothetical protein
MKRIIRPRSAKADGQCKQPKFSRIGLLSLLTGVLVAAFCAYQAASESQQTSKPIEQLRVGQKVRTEAPREALTAAEGELSHLLVHDEPTVDPATWKLVRLRAEQRWDDGTLDDINVETLQPPQWLAEHHVRVGGEVPLPLDLVEMGLPMDLQAKVLAIERCPPLEAGPGRTVLTTVNHLNRDVVEVTIRDAQGREERIRPTGLHKFYSATRDDWLSAADLEIGEQLDGLNGLHTVVALRPISGTHRVYNMTVEAEHVYRVAENGLLVHNNGCVKPYRPVTPGMENHHAVLNVWAKHNIPGYKGGMAPTIPLTPEGHAATKEVYRAWLRLRTGKPVGGHVDWKTVSPREIQELTNQMLDAADVSQNVRREYFQAFHRFIYTGSF